MNTNARMDNTWLIDRNTLLIPTFAITCLFCTFLLFSLTDAPRLSLLIVDTLFCYFCASSFKHKTRMLFLLHPLAIGILSLCYDNSFLVLGDGNAYSNVVKSTIPYYSGAGDSLSFLEQIIHADSISSTFKTLSLGVVPTFLVPDYLYDVKDDTVYYIWQSTWLVIMVSGCLTIAKKWKIMSDDILYSISLFSVISPTLLELGSAPTRHYVTFISLWLFYISFIAFMQRGGLFKLAWLLISILLIAISKMGYVIGISLFASYYLWDKKSGPLHLKTLLFLCLISSGLLLFPLITNLISSYYINTSVTTINLGSILSVIMAPITLIVIKYIYSILSPFPWHKALFFIHTIYGGNDFFFILHILSSLTGIYFLTRLLLYAKPLLCNYPELKHLFCFGGIVSSSILFGSLGFHSYIAVTFPFFAPLFLVKQYAIPLRAPILIALFIEITALVVESLSMT